MDESSEQLREQLTAQNNKAGSNYVPLARQKTAEFVHGFGTIEISPGRHEVMQERFSCALIDKFHQATINRILWDNDLTLLSIGAARQMKG